MAKFTNPLFPIGFALLVAVYFGACNTDTSDQLASPVVDHDHDMHGADEHGADGGTNEHGFEMADFASGVAELKDLYQAIKTAFADGDVDKAHGPLHRIGEVLESTPKMAAKSELSDDDRKAVKEAVDQMFASYGTIDGALHKGKEADYTAVAANLDDNMGVLEAIAAKTAKETPDAAGQK